MEYNVFRRSFSAGVALVGVGAITFASVAVPVEHSIVAAPGNAVGVRAVALSGYAEILAGGAAAAIEQSIDGLFKDTPGLWNQVMAQWPDADLTHWNYALVTDAVLAPLAPLVIGPFNDALAEVLAQRFPYLQEEFRQLPAAIEYSVVRLVGPMLSAIGGAGAAHAQIFYSMTTLELPPFFEAIAAAPVHVIDGLLFGGYGDLRPLLTGEVGGEPIPAPGLLTPWGQAPAPRPIKWAPDASTSSVESAQLDDGELQVQPGEELTGRAESSVARVETVVAEAMAAIETTQSTADAAPLKKPEKTGAVRKAIDAIKDKQDLRKSSMRQSLRDAGAKVRKALSLPSRKSVKSTNGTA